MASEAVRRAAVLGSPITHSLSPLIHQAGYTVCGLTGWSYDRRDVRADELAGVVAALDGSWRGLSLTMPLKEAGAAVATWVHPLAERTGSVNTLVRRSDGGWDAHNTDVHGIVAALAPAGPRQRAVVIGSGATARSAVLACRGLGVRQVSVAARNPGAARSVAALADADGVLTSVHPLDHWGGLGADLVVSTVPASASTALAALVPQAPDAVLLDVVYAGWPTPLATAATQAGMVVVSGLDMLVHQAAAQFELFTGVAAPVPEMLAAGRTALSR